MRVRRAQLTQLRWILVILVSILFQRSQCLVVNEARTRDGVAHAGSLDHLLALEEELEVAVDLGIGPLTRQVEVVRQTLLAHSDCRLARLELRGQLGHLEVVCLVGPVQRRGAVFVAQTVLGQRNRTLDRGFSGISPLARIVAHEEGAVGMEVDAGEGHVPGGGFLEELSRPVKHLL